MEWRERFALSGEMCLGQVQRAYADFNNERDLLKGEGEDLTKPVCRV